MSAATPQAAMPVVRDPADFDRRSGNLLERLVFNNRIPVLLFVGIATLVLGFFALKLQVNASFERMIPVASPYIQNYFKYRKELPGLGNTLRIVDEMDQSRVRHLDCKASETVRINGRNTTVTGQDLVKVDAAQIHMG